MGAIARLIDTTITRIEEMIGSLPQLVEIKKHQLCRNDTNKGNNS